MGMKLEEEHGHENSERWLLTYSDMITLCMAFFMVLYAMSQVDLKKYKSLGGSLQKAFHTSGVVQTVGTGTGNVIGSAGSASPIQLPFERISPEFRKMAEEVDQYSKENQLGSTVHLSFDERGMVIGLSDQLLFPPGSAELTGQARRVLAELASILKPSKNHIRVEGHTDNVPIRSARYPSNWQLSTDRATNVIMFWLNKSSLPPDRLSAAGYGEYRPLVPNDSEQHRALNRRVDIIVLRVEYSKLEPHDHSNAVTPSDKSASQGWATSAQEH